jgi:predicted AlkP superfamily pyrophosphatase or phosphodiesterase
MVTKKVVLVWLDAFSDRYLRPELCPFSYSLSEKCFFAKISPLFAYIGIKYCFDLGVSINTHKVWNDHVFNGFCIEKSLKRSLFRKMLRFVDGISFNDGLNKILRYVLFKVSNVEYGIPHLIPANLIDFFQMPEKYYRGKNLYEVLREHGIRYVKREPKLNIAESSTIRSIPKLLESYDFVFIKLNSLDRLGHEYGPLSEAVRRRVKYLDGLLRWLVGALDNDVVLIIMSDHGMTPVMCSFNLINFLRSRGCEYGRHYMSFVGATYASFWFLNQNYRDAIVEELSRLKIGKFLTLDDKVKLGIDNIGEEYGEEIFVIKEKNVFFPEFYHVRKPSRGMHGYAFGKYDAPIFLMYGGISLNLKIGNIDFVDIMPTILQLLNVPVPSHVEGVNLLSKVSL